MTVQSGNELGNHIVVGYFSDGADALRAINELVDEGFRASDIGAAFRTPGDGGSQPGMAMEGEDISRDAGLSEDMTRAGDRNPAAVGSVGGAASHDEAVTPAGLAPGSGNAFPAASRPGPIPGSEIPSELPHDLPSTLSHDLPSTLHPEQTAAAPVSRATSVPVAGAHARHHHGGWADRVKHVFGGSRPEEGGGPRLADASSQKFGTGEGRLNLSPSYSYSGTAFESSFVGMGLGAQEARSLSGELGYGGAVVSVAPGGRAALVEGIIERNRGVVRFESIATREPLAEEDRRVEIFGKMQDYYRSEDDLRQRRAS